MDRQIGVVKWVDGLTRTVFEEPDGRQWLHGDDGEQVYGVWLHRPNEADVPVVVEAPVSQDIRIGGCGWSYKDWLGNFYPKGTKPGDYLRVYAERFKVVEVDATFYAIPARKTVEGWAEKTPEDFGFSLKVPQVITHEKLLRGCEGELDAFLGGARLLGPKLLCCLLQFGFFNRKVLPTLESFLERLDPFLSSWPKDIPVAVEIRNKTWMTEELTACLRRHSAVLALCDQAWMPTPWAVMQRLDVVTGAFAYVRLLGDRAAVDKLTETLVVADRCVDRK